jgi:hypothetical protein
MLTFSQPKLEIVECDNGYVVEWRDETARKAARSISDLEGLAPESGVKIFSTKTQVAAFIAGFFRRT